MLINDAQRRTLLANGRAYVADPSFDPQPVVKLFDPLGSGTWLLTDLDPDDPDIASGLCDLGFGCPEIGTVRISELETIARMPGRHGIGIEADRLFQPNRTIRGYALEANRCRRIMV